MDGEHGGSRVRWAMLDRHECYELCVQSPRHVVALLRGLYRAAASGEAITLREDFCGTAAVSRRWCAEGMRSGGEWKAIGCDSDSEVIARARELAGAEGVEHGLQLVHADCVAACERAVPDTPRAGSPRVRLESETQTAPDVIWVGNFSIGYIHDRASLIRYLGACRARLQRGNAGFGGGVFACDTYGGASAFKLGAVERKHPSRGREMIRYVWSHDAADPLTGMVENSISFRVELDGEVVTEMPRAFVYRWRLWSIAELRVAMMDAGFTRTEVYKDVNVAPGEAPRSIDDPRELGDDWVVVVAAW